VGTTFLISDIATALTNRLTMIRHPNVRRLAIGLALVTALVILLDLAARAARMAGLIGEDMSNWAAVSQDYSIAEVMGFMELAVAAFVLYGAARQFNQKHLLFWAALSAFLLIDDAFRLHDGSHDAIGRALFTDSGVFLAKHKAEILYAVVVLTVMLVLFAATHRKAGFNTIADAVILAVPVALIGFCAVVLDELNQLIETLETVPQRVKVALSLLEDGGEFASMGLLALAAVVIYRFHQTNAPLETL
jgi:hypothetical protein